jgi:hypothetical protein
MGTLQERYFSKLDYFRGTVMDIKDLNRVRLIDAKATLILADRTASDADADDAANIMRARKLSSIRRLVQSSRKPSEIQISQQFPGGLHQKLQRRCSDNCPTLAIP